MALDKAIENGKEYRKQYHGSEAIARSCRCHGGCDYCKGRRMYKYLRKIEKAEQDLKEWEEDEG